MVNPNGCVKGIHAYVKKRQLAKAKRLLKNKPLYKDEKYMNKEDYEKYIDRFLTIAEDALPNVDQTKIAVSMYDKKCKYDSAEKNPLAEDIDEE